MMSGTTKADKRKVHNLLKKFGIWHFYTDLNLNLYNPYNYYKSKKYIIIIHSAIEYFFEIEYKEWKNDNKLYRR